MTEPMPDPTLAPRNFPTALVLLIAGFVAVVAGVAISFGLGVALIVAGVLLVVAGIDLTR